jgi:hypothetical protein
MLTSGIVAFVDASPGRPERPGSLLRAAVLATAATGAILGAMARSARRRRA